MTKPTPLGMEGGGGAGKERRPSQRLPVNPRRHKVAPEQRKRVSTACNSCNVRRIKCSGHNPCKACASSNRDCVYPTQIEKISVTKAELDELRRKIDLYEKALHDTLPDPTKRQEALYLAATSPGSSTSSQSPFSASASLFHSGGAESASSSIKLEPQDDDTAATARLLQDSTGRARFLGETSGATFLDHLKELIGAVLPMNHQQQRAPYTPYDGSTFLSTLGKYYTSENVKPKDQNVNPLVLPPDETIQSMFTELRYVLQDGNGDWPSGGLYWYGDMTNAPPPPPPMVPGSFDLEPFRYLAFTHVALATAGFSTLDWPPPNRLYDNSYSDTCISRASMLLRNPLDIGRSGMQDVSALLLMGFYLIETSKRDSAYMHIAAAAHMCIMLGAHRGWVDEQGKRVFWTVYILDRWVSCLMGRPPILADDAIRVPPPADAPNMPPAAGLAAHVELSRISGYVVCNTYRIAPSDSAAPSEMTQNPAKVMWMLEQWKRSLPPVVQLCPEGVSNDPAVCMLHMRYNQLVIVATRPLFFIAVKKSVAERLMSHTATTDLNSRLGHLKSCIESAKSNMRLARHFIMINRHARQLHTLLHYALSAAVCLILQDLVYSQGSLTSEEIMDKDRDIQYAISLLDEDELCRGESQQSGTCTQALHDLRVLVARLVARPENTHDGIPHSDPTQGQPMGFSNAFPIETLQVGSEPGLYNELVTWMNDDWLSYNSFVENP